MHSKERQRRLDSAITASRAGHFSTIAVPALASQHPCRMAGDTTARAANGRKRNSRGKLVMTDVRVVLAKAGYKDEQRCMAYLEDVGFLACPPDVRQACYRRADDTLEALDAAGLTISRKGEATLSNFVDGMEPLGADFERVWNENTDKLYEADPKGEADALRDALDCLISEAAQTKAELLSDDATSNYRHGWQSGRLSGFEDARTALANTDGGWIDIKSAPKDGTEFFAWVIPGSEESRARPERLVCRVRGGAFEYKHSHGWFRFLGEKYLARKLTHWRPLPTPPTEAE